ncbi:hypothetical protein B0H11DRAFT_2218933 [Mycena galericulata]|nr:hypothetical protein B0H11DRAFT_2218933 [Mycena galericulata]
MSSPTDNSSTLNPPQSVIESTFGALVMGLWIQQFFLGLIALQAAQYYWHFSERDSKFYLWLVAALLILNVLEAGMDAHVLYRSTVAYYGDYRFFDLQTWTMWAEPAVTAIVGFLAQLFFMWRCWNVTNRSRLVFVVLTIMLLLSLGSGLAVSISFFQVKLFSKLAKIPIPISFWLVSTAVTDLTIAGILSVSLYRSKTSFKRTGTVIMRIITLTIETSVVTALIAVLNFIFYFALPATAYHLYPQFSICRVYTITVLTTLHKRDDLRKALDSNTYCSSFALTVPTQNKVEVNVKRVVARDMPNESIKEDENENERKQSSTDSKVVWTDAV